MHIHNFESFLNESFVSLEESKQLAAIEEALILLENDENVDEGLKEIIMAGLMSLMAVGGVSAQTVKHLDRHTEKSGIFNNKTKTDITDQYTFKLNDRMTKEKADKVIDRLLKSGWTLNSSQLDTIWKTVTEKNPETVMEVISLNFSDKAYFESGKFTISESMKSDIKLAMDSIIEENGTIMKIDITSSTDKQQLSKNLQTTLKGLGYEGNNKGLSEARAASISDYMTGMGVNDTIINKETLAEQGTDEIDQSARYVTVDFMYIIVKGSGTPTNKQTPSVDYVVQLQKSIETKTRSNPPKLKSSHTTKDFSNSVKHFKLKKHTGSLKTVKCPKFKGNGPNGWGN